MAFEFKRTLLSTYLLIILITINDNNKVFCNENHNLNIQTTQSNVTKLKKLENNELIIKNNNTESNHSELFNNNNNTNTNTSNIERITAEAMFSPQINPALDFNDFLNITNTDNTTDNLFINDEINKNLNSNNNETSFQNIDNKNNNDGFKGSPYLGSIQDDYKSFSFGENLNYNHNNKFKFYYSNNDFNYGSPGVGSVSEPIFPYKYLRDQSNKHDINLSSVTSLSSTTDNPVGEIILSNMLKIKNENNGQKIKFQENEDVQPKNNYNRFNYNDPITQYNPPKLNQIHNHYYFPYEDSKSKKFNKQNNYQIPTNSPPISTNLQKPTKFHENYKPNHMKDFINSIFFTTAETKVSGKNNFFGLFSPASTSPASYVAFPETKNQLKEYESISNDYGLPHAMSSAENPLKKAIKMLAALLPLGLFVAALTPTIIHINSTQAVANDRIPVTPPTNKGRSVIDEYNSYSNNLYENILKNISKIILNECDLKDFCEIAVRGSLPNADLEDKYYWWLVERTPDEISKFFNLNDTFEEIKQKSCIRFKCTDSTKINATSKLLKQNIKSRNVVRVNDTNGRQIRRTSKISDDDRKVREDDDDYIDYDYED